MNLPDQSAGSGDRNATPAEGGAPDQRGRLFEAVIKVALERGCAHVTLAAVARRAGISKGGLLYHFKSKAELIKAMLDHYDDGWLGKALKKQEGQGEPEPVDPLAVAMLVAAANAPSLLEVETMKTGGAAVVVSQGPYGVYQLLSRRLGMRRTAHAPVQRVEPDRR